MLRSLFQSRLSNQIKVGEETQQIRIQFLLPIVFFTLIASITSALVTLISREFTLMVVLILSAIILFVCFEMLRNKTLQVPTVLFMIQGYALLTATILFESVNPLSGILFVILYLMIAGIIFNPKAFVLIFLYSAGLIFLMISEVILPVFSSPDLPVWFNSASLIVATGLIGMVGCLSYRAVHQSLQIAIDSNKKRDQVEQEKWKFMSIVEQSPMPTFITDLEGTIEYVNTHFCELTGYTTDEVLGKNPRMFKTEFTPVEFYDYLWAAIRAGEQWVGELVNRRKDGSIVYIGAKLSSLLDADGKPAHFLAFEEDITQRKLLENEVEQTNQQMQAQKDDLSRLNDQLQEQSRKDPLTGLYNRVYLGEILPREILRSMRARNHLILMVIDVDHFRSINDRFGHATGDLVLQSIAKQITESMNRYDLAFRFGGDKFLLLFSGTTDEFGMSRAEQLRKNFENHPIQVDEREILLMVSIGMTIYPLHGKQEDELLTKAEKALTISRQSGGNRVTLWKEELNEET